MSSVQMATSRLPMALSGFEIAGIHLASGPTFWLFLDAATYVGRITYNLNVVQDTGAQTAWSAQEEQGRHAMAGAFVTKAWKEPVAAPARQGFVEQPVKPVLLMTFLGPTVQQCAVVSTVCATAESVVTELVSACLRTGGPGVTSPSPSVQPCSAQKTPDAHLQAKMKPNSSANAFPVTKGTARTARPSTHA